MLGLIKKQTLPPGGGDSELRADPILQRTATCRAVRLSSSTPDCRSARCSPDIEPTIGCAHLVSAMTFSRAPVVAYAGLRSPDKLEVLTACPLPDRTTTILVRRRHHTPVQPEWHTVEHALGWHARARGTATATLVATRSARELGSRLPGPGLPLRAQHACQQSSSSRAAPLTAMRTDVRVRSAVCALPQVGYDEWLRRIPA